MKNRFKTIILDYPHLDLKHTLASGQTFCWKFLVDGWWDGWINGRRVRLKMVDEGVLQVDGPVSENDVCSYFHDELSWCEILEDIQSRDALFCTILPHLKGLRLVREPWWECTSNFICSAMKQVEQNERINFSLRRRFGLPVDGAFAFPRADFIAEASEVDLRECKLGYRARHVIEAAREVTSKTWSWTYIESLPLSEAKQHLMQLRGVGGKVAECILLTAGGFLDALPMDVWMIRILRELYWKKKREPAINELADLGRQKLGHSCGVAQLLLFHWYRTQNKK